MHFGIAMAAFAQGLGYQTPTLITCISLWRTNLPPQKKPAWNQVKAQLRDYDHRALMSLLQDLYDSSKENQAFLHARLRLGENTLRPFKETISRWLWPDILRNQNISVSKAKKAISDYKKAAGRPEDLIELMVFYCEQASGFSNDIGLDDIGYFDALVRMFEQSLRQIKTLPVNNRSEFIPRLQAVAQLCQNFGYGVSDDMDALLLEYHGS